MTKLLLLFTAVGLGVLARFGLGGLIHRWLGNSFPYGTFAINLLGCLLFGLVWSLAEVRMVIGAETRFILLTGFLGAFTTFSTYAFETTGLLANSQWPLAMLNLLGQSILGLLAVVGGMALGRLI
jgi:CrcB protein